MKRKKGKSQVIEQEESEGRNRDTGRGEMIKRKTKEKEGIRKEKRRKARGVKEWNKVVEGREKRKGVV